MPECSKTFLLAAGNHTRWPENCKQLANIDGEPLIRHTLRQLEKYSTETTVVTHRSEIFQAVHASQAQVLCPACNDTPLSTMMSTAYTWRGAEVVVLLGDVLFSDDALSLIMTDVEPLQFFGTTGEIFALTLRTIQAQIEVARTVPAVVRQMGCGEQGAKFWYLYHQLHNRRPHPELRYIGGRFTFIRDYTTDIDTPQTYVRLLQERPWANGRTNDGEK